MAKKKLTKAPPPRYPVITQIQQNTGGRAMCLNPMLALKLNDVNPETGKHQYKFIGALKNLVKPGTVFEQQLREKGRIEWYDDWLDDPRSHRGMLQRFRRSWHERYDTPEQYDDYCLRSTYLIDESTGEVLNRAVVLPCGQCLECRCNKAREWAARIMLESQYHEQSYFITLTYDEEHIPCAVTKDGEVVYTLDPGDLQLFLKRLRRQQSYYKDNNIRFYAVGEYGATYHRPHYHLIVFGLKLDDIVEVGRNKRGAMLHDSETIGRLWSRGITQVDVMTFESAAYCARYTTKKLGKAGDEDSVYNQLGLVPEFSRMSLRPAIGAQYLEDHMTDIYKYDQIYLSTAKGGKKLKPPKYYDDKYDDVYPDSMAEIKGNRREIAEKAFKARMENFSGSYVELLSQTADAYISRTRSLRRDLQ